MSAYERKTLASQFGTTLFIKRLLKNKLWRALVTVMCLSGLTAPCHAVTFNYSGTVVEATGGFGQLIPAGTSVSGFMVFADDAVQSGFVGEADLEDLSVQLGGFCIYLQNINCAGVGLPLNLIDYVGITFDNAGNVTGGKIYAATLSPADPYVPWYFDFDTNTMGTDIAGIGVLTANTTLVQAVPIPGALWLFGSAGLLLTGLRKCPETRFRVELFVD